MLSGDFLVRPRLHGEFVVPSGSDFFGGSYTRHEGYAYFPKTNNEEPAAGGLGAGGLVHCRHIRQREQRHSTTSPGTGFRFAEPYYIPHSCAATPQAKYSFVILWSGSTSARSWAPKLPAKSKTPS